jgi:hypothetical protein
MSLLGAAGAAVAGALAFGLLAALYVLVRRGRAGSLVSIVAVVITVGLASALGWPAAVVLALLWLAVLGEGYQAGLFDDRLAAVRALRRRRRRGTVDHDPVRLGGLDQRLRRGRDHGRALRHVIEGVDD